MFSNIFKMLDHVTDLYKATTIMSLRYMNLKLTH